MSGQINQPNLPGAQIPNVPFVHSNLNRVVQRGAISLRRSPAANGAAAGADNPPRPAHAAESRYGGPIPIGKAESRNGGPIPIGKEGETVGGDPLAVHLQRARAGQSAPRPANNYWKHLRYNTTGVWADAVIRATWHRQYNHAQNLPLPGIDTAMYYRQGMPPTQDQGNDEHRPRSPHGPPPLFSGMRQMNAGSGLHNASVDPSVPIGSFSIDINRLINRVPVEMRTFRLQEDNAFIMIETTLAKISEQDPLHLFHMMQSTWAA